MSEQVLRLHTMPKEDGPGYVNLTPSWASIFHMAGNQSPGMKGWGINLVLQSLPDEFKESRNITPVKVFLWLFSKDHRYMVDGSDVCLPLVTASPEQVAAVDTIMRLEQLRVALVKNRSVDLIRELVGKAEDRVEEAIDTIAREVL